MVLSKDLKIAICFGLIMGAILSLCNLCFAAETEIVDCDYVDGLRISNASNTFVSASSTVGYFQIEPGYTYTVTNNLNRSKSLATSTDIPSLNGSLTYIGALESGESFTFNSSTFGYVYFDFASYNDVVVTREPLEGMTNFIDNIVYSLSIGELSDVWVLVVPILAISVLLGLGFYLLKRLLNRIKRAKGGA